MLAFAGLATVTPDGRLSVKAALVLLSSKVLKRRIVRTLVPFTSIGLIVKNLPMLTLGRIVRVAEGLLLLDTPWADVRAPTGKLLIWLPSVIPVKVTERVQVDRALMLAPDRVTELAPGTAVMTPLVHPVPVKVGLGGV